MPHWNPDLYLQFDRQRTQAAIDLVNRIELDSPTNIVDLGCGPGNSTAILRARWPRARIVGLDSSSDMIAQARERELDAEWIHADIATWQPDAPPDLLFANAALQWLPDHAGLLQRLAAFLPPGGVLAVQLPFHHQSPLQQVVLEASRDPRWHDAMAQARQALTWHDTAYYYDALINQCASIDLWETEYLHVMPNHEAILDFIRGSGLRPFTQTLHSDDDIAHFETLVLQGYRHHYKTRPNSEILFPFRRQFILTTV